MPPKSDITISSPVDIGDRGVPSLHKDIDGNYQVPSLDSRGNTKASYDDLIIALQRLINAILLPPNMDMSTYRARVTAILDSTTLTTVTTVTGLSSVGTTNLYQAQDMVLGANLTAWAMCCRERIS